MKSGFFISPDGVLFPVETTHIKAVISHPDKFGMTRVAIKGIYRKYHEPLGLEGYAREEILSALIRQGWIRIRHYQDYWSVQINKMTKQTLGRLITFSNMALKGTHPFSGKEWGDEPVRLTLQSSGDCRNFTMQELADNPLRSDMDFNEYDSVKGCPLKVMDIDAYAPKVKR